jgi:hypothetical protein
MKANEPPSVIYLDKH